MFGVRSVNDVLKKIQQMNEKMHEHAKDTDKRLDNIEKVLLAQEINLKEHMKRSDNLEEMVKIIQEKELKPLSKHVSMVEGALKLVGILGIVATIIGTIVKIFGIV
jgi:hypothetical protein